MVDFLEPSDERWLKMINSNSESQIFHHPAWMTIIADFYRYRPFIVAKLDASDNVLAGIPMMEVEDILMRKRWISLPFSDYCNPLFQDKRSLELLINDLVEISNKNHMMKIMLRWEYPENNALIPYENYYNYLIKIDEDVDKAYKQIKYTTRQQIKKARRDGVRVEWGCTLDHLKQFYNMQILTRRKHGVPVQPWGFFKLFYKYICEQKLGYVLNAFIDDRCIAGMVIILWNKTLMCKYGASDPKYQKYHPNHLLIWEAIEWGCKNGYSHIDLGRTDIDEISLRKYKLNWGSEEKPLIYTNINAEPPILSSGSLMMSIVKPIIQKSPVMVCRLAGELFYKYFA